MIRTRTCSYQGIRNVNFSENFAYVLNEWLIVEKVFRVLFLEPEIFGTYRNGYICKSINKRSFIFAKNSFWHNGKIFEIFDFLYEEFCWRTSNSQHKPCYRYHFAYVSFKFGRFFSSSTIIKRYVTGSEIYKPNFKTENTHHKVLMIVLTSSNIRK